MKPKEIVYKKTNNSPEVVADNVYRGMRYVCLNNGFFPSAYVICDQAFLDRYADYYDIEGIHVHGGVTYTGPINQVRGLQDYEGVCFGWEYGHIGDWQGYMSDAMNVSEGNKKYNTRNLINDCKNVIDQCLTLKKNETAEITQGERPLTKDCLKKMGFVPHHDIDMKDESAMYLTGGEEGNKWKIFFNFMTPSMTYVTNQNPRKKFMGVITTVEELKAAITLCKIPIEICDGGLRKL